MKKVFALILAFVLAAFCVVGVSAETVTKDNHKESYQSYAGKGFLKCTSEPVYSFDNADRIISSHSVSIDTADKKEGTGALSVKLNGDTGGIKTLFETKNNTLAFSVGDRLKESVKMWVYVNDIDLLDCDHDNVYDTPQENSGTLFFYIGVTGGSQGNYVLQHTIEGSGWHLIEISFNTHNNSYPSWKKTNLKNVKWMRVNVQGRKGLELKFDGLTKYTYSNEGYTQPKLEEKNARWISTCDYDALDGAVLSEWYASSFDTKDKIQGNSSLSITGRLEHVDYRCVWSGMNVPVDRLRDILHFEMYISDLDLVGTDFQARLAQCESGEGQACYSFGYNQINRHANLGDGLKNGWNVIDMPVNETSNNVDTGYYNEHGGLDFKADRLVFFWAGTSKTEWYTVKYDNIYLYEKSPSGNKKPVSSGNANFSLSDENVARYAKEMFEGKRKQMPTGCTEEDKNRIISKFELDYPDYKLEVAEDGTVTVKDKSYLGMALIIAGVAILLAVLVAVVIIFVLPKKKKAKAPQENVPENVTEDNKD